MAIRVGIADEQEIFLLGLEKLLLSFNGDVDVEIAWKVGNGRDLKENMSQNQVDLLLMELRLPKIDGLDLIGEFKKTYPETKIVVLSQYFANKFVKAAFQSGADGYLLKQNGLEDLKQSLVDAMEGKTFMGANVNIGPQNHIDNDSPKKKDFELTDPFLLKYSLTPREVQILSEIIRRKTNKQIARDLFISDQTVSVHRKNIMRKLKVNNAESLIDITNEYKLLA